MSEPPSLVLSVPTSAAGHVRRMLSNMFEQLIPENVESITLNFEPESFPESEIEQRAYTYFALCLDQPLKPPFDIYRIPQFHAELMNRPLSIPPVTAFNQFPMAIPFPLAVLLTEAFGNSIKRQYVCSIDKPFQFEQCVLILRLIAPLPVAFVMNPQTTQVTLSFADTAAASAEFIRDQVKIALRLFERRHVPYSQFGHVRGAEFTQDDAKKLSSQLGFTILRSSDQITDNFSLWAIPTCMKDLQSFQTACKSILQSVSLYKCTQCHQLFTQKEQEHNCVFEFHRGDQIPFEDGSMELLSQEEDGTMITFVNYSCCGEVPKGSEPCDAIECEHHSLQTTTSSTYSTEMYC